MSRDELPYINFSDAEQAARFIRHVATLRGTYRVMLERPRDQLSRSQLGYIWAVCYPYLAHGLRDVWGNKFAKSWDAHCFAKAEFLKRPLIDIRTGEARSFSVPSLGSLPKDVTADYIDKMQMFSLEEFGREIPPPSKFFTEPGERAA